MSKSRQASGQITFRCAVDVHKELLEVAGYLGIDMNGLLNQMIRHALPAFLQQATTIAAQHAAARAELGRVSLGSHPLVSQILDIGRPLMSKNRLKKMTEAAARHRRDRDPAVEDLVRYALDVLKAEDETAEIRKVLGTPPYDATSDLREGTRVDRILE